MDRIALLEEECEGDEYIEPAQGHLELAYMQQEIVFFSKLKKSIRIYMIHQNFN